MKINFYSKIFMNACMFIGVVHVSHLHADSKKQMKALQEQFLKMQKNIGIFTPDKMVAESYPVKGKQASQDQFNLIRTQIHAMLNQPSVDAAKVKEKIAQFEAMNPGRWPQPADYRELLARRTLAMKEAAKKQQPPLPAIPRKKQPPLPPLPARAQAAVEDELPPLVSMSATMPAPSAPPLENEPGQPSLRWGDVR